MKRIIVQISPDKWYHLETLKKYYKNGWELSNTKYSDIYNTLFTVAIFRKQYMQILFLIHPKTKRLRYYSNDSAKELGLVLR